jgi:hypothetical protein
LYLSLWLVPEELPGTKAVRGRQHRTRVFEHYDSIQQISVVMFSRGLGEFGRVARENAGIGRGLVLIEVLIDLLHAIHDGPTLEGNSAAVIGHRGVGVDNLGLHVKGELDRIPGFPTPFEGKILARGCAGNFFPIHLDVIPLRPARDADE